MGDSPVAIHVHMPCIPRASCIMTLQVHRRIIAGSGDCFFQSARGSLAGATTTICRTGKGV